VHYDNETIGTNLNKAPRHLPRRIVVFGAAVLRGGVAMPLLWMVMRVHSSRRRGPADPRPSSPTFQWANYSQRRTAWLPFFLNSVKLANG